MFDKVTFNWQNIKNPSKEIFTKKIIFEIALLVKSSVISHLYFTAIKFSLRSNLAVLIIINYRGKLMLPQD